MMMSLPALRAGLYKAIYVDTEEPTTNGSDHFPMYMAIALAEFLHTYTPSPPRAKRELFSTSSRLKHVLRDKNTLRDYELASAEAALSFNHTCDTLPTHGPDE